jgi:hypothetical protein
VRLLSRRRVSCTARLHKPSTSFKPASTQPMISARSRLTRSVRNALSMVRIWDTLITESLGSLDWCLSKRKVSAISSPFRCAASHSEFSGWVNRSRRFMKPHADFALDSCIFHRYDLVRFENIPMKSTTRGIGWNA